MGAEEVASKMELDSGSAAELTDAKSEVDQEKMKADVEALASLAKNGQQQQAIDGLLAIEKVGRLAEDITSTLLACTSILEVLHDAGDWKALQEYILLLSKRRSQLKQVVQAMVRQCMGYLDSAPDSGTRTELIKSLQAITEGKIYVEIERARLTRELARMKEAEGNVAEAAEILQEVAVETFGAMAKTEKIAYILEQVRLCLDREDYVRAQILARKVSPRAFVAPAAARKAEAAGDIGIEGTAIEAPAPGTPSLEELKLLYYGLMVRHHAHESNYLEMCRCYRAILDTPAVAEDAARWTCVLKKAAWYSVLAPSDSDQRTLLAATAADRRVVDELPAYAALLAKFSGKEVVWWKALSGEYAAEIEELSYVFGGDDGKKRREDLRLRVIEHNVDIISGYYVRITTARLAQMLDLPPEEAEQRLCDMVTGRGLAAKVDRPAGVIRFGGRTGAGEALNQWSSSIGKLLELVEKTCQGIQKEFMLYKVPIGAA